MTQREQIIQLLDSAGIVWTAGVAEVDDDFYSFDSDTVHVIRATARTGPHNHGYTNFTTEFYFDADGKFVSIGAWE